MTVLDLGHRYALKNHEGKNEAQTVQFIKKDVTITGAGALETVQDGTTNEEVLAMIIDRLQYLNSKLPCRENSVALTHIETALLWLQKRTADRIARNVENTTKP